MASIMKARLYSLDDVHFERAAERCDLVDELFQVFRICAKGMAKLYGSIWLTLLEKAV